MSLCLLGICISAGCVVADHNRREEMSGFKSGLVSELRGATDLKQL